MFMLFLHRHWFLKAAVGNHGNNSEWVEMDVVADVMCTSLQLLQQFTCTTKEKWIVKLSETSVKKSINKWTYNISRV